MNILSNKNLMILLLIILVAIIFRFYGLGQADVIQDESINSFRALGYIDFFAEGKGQETVINWFDNPPAWTKLSFHDYPPLHFLANGLFLNIFGPTAWVEINNLQGELSLLVYKF